VQLAHIFGAPSHLGEGVVLHHFSLPPFSCQDVLGLYIRLDEQISTLRVLSRHYGGLCTKNGFGNDEVQDIWILWKCLEHCLGPGGQPPKPISS
jgi:hypothetical protein